MKQRYHIVLASNSPRRKELLAGLGVAFSVRVQPGIDESYPGTLAPREVPGFIAARKADAYRFAMAADELVVTADTVVVTGREILGKPAGCCGCSAGRPTRW